MLNFHRQAICDGVHFNSIYDDRFKTGRISAVIFLPLAEKTAAANAIFPHILIERCKKHPSLELMNRRMAELYGASISANVFKLGDAQALAISVVGLDDKYSLEKEQIAKALTDLLCGVLFEPFLDENGFFDQGDLAQQKRQLLEAIDAEYNDKRLFARIRCEELMCKNEPSGVNRYGKREDVENLSAADATNAWRNALKSAKIELLQLGGADTRATFDTFKCAFSKFGREKTCDCTTKIIESAPDVSEYSDFMDVTQCKLVLGFRSGVTAPMQNSQVLSLFNALFGGTAHSKLFLNVREKQSLCYYCSSRYYGNKGILFVQSGVERHNLEKTKEEVLNQLEEIKNGNFTQDELSAAKLSMQNEYRSVSDYLRSLENFYTAQAFNNTFESPEDLAKSVEKITREEIIAAANKITLDTVYNLKCRED